MIGVDVIQLVTVQYLYEGYYINSGILQQGVLCKCEVLSA